MVRLPGDPENRWVDVTTGEIVGSPLTTGDRIERPDGFRAGDGDEYPSGVAVRLPTLRVGPGLVRVTCSGLSNPEADLARIETALALADAVDAFTGTDVTVVDEEGDEEMGPQNVVQEFSRRSRQRLRQTGGELDWHTALETHDGGRVGMVTLTYPGDWLRWAPDPATVVRHRQAFDRRFERALGRKPTYLWKRESQRRGAPHIHLGGVWPLLVNGEPFRHWVSRIWFEIVGSDDPAHLAAGTGVDWAEGFRSSDPNRMAAYFAGYGSAKGSKEYQNHTPEGWTNPNGSVGRHWGYIGVNKVGAEARISRDDLIEAKRYLRAYLASQKRTTALRANRGARSVTELPDGSFQARYIDPTTGEWTTVPDTFTTRSDAERWLAGIRTGPGQRKRTVNRRYRLRSLVGTDTGFTFLTNDGPAVAVDLARAINPTNNQPWPKGERRPLP